jgi:hypothetical protein
LETQRLLDDVGADRWATSDLLIYANDAQNLFCRLTDLYKPDYSQITVNANEYEASVSNLVGEILRVQLASDGTPLTRITEEKLSIIKPGWRSDAAGTPTRYMHGKRNWDRITVHPKPSANTNLHILAIVLPPAMVSGGQAPSIPTEYHPALAFFAAYRALQRNNDASSLALAQQYKLAFDGYVGLTAPLAEAN